MSLEALLVGVMALGAGTLFCFAGYPFFLLILPVWGFVVGFQMGAAMVAAVDGGGFLGSVVGLIAGLLIGAFAAGVSYLYWWGAVLIAGATLGYLATAVVLAAVGLELDALTFVASLAAAAGAAYLMYRLEVPQKVTILATALAGAASIAAGISLLVGNVSLEGFRAGVVAAALESGTAYVALALALAVVGAAVQLRAAPRYGGELRRAFVDGLARG